MPSPMKSLEQPTPPGLSHLRSTPSPIKQQIRHVPKPNPSVVLPVQQTQRHFRPIQHAQHRPLGIAEACASRKRVYMTREPLTQQAIAGCAVVGNATVLKLNAVLLQQNAKNPVFTGFFKRTA